VADHIRLFMTDTDDALVRGAAVLSDMPNLTKSLTFDFPPFILNLR